MDKVEIARIDFEQLLSERYPNKKLPKFVIRLLEKVLCIDKINKLFASAKGKKNLEFIDVCMKNLDLTCKVVGAENLPDEKGPLIFVCNHPQGGVEAICLAYILGHKYDGKIKFHANEFLTSLDPLKELFLPIYKHRQQNKENSRTIAEFYETDDHLITFPAGVTSFRKNGKIIDHEWRKSFIKAATKYQRNVVPLYFQAKNSNLFYCIENFRKLIHFPINFEVVLFAREFFKQQGNNFTLFVGKPIDWKTFNNTKSAKEWTKEVRQVVYNLADQNLSDDNFFTMIDKLKKD